MQASRSALRASRTAGRLNKRQWQQSRFQSTNTSTATSNPAVVGAAAGAAAAVVVGYGYYRYTGAHKLVNAASETQAYINSAQKKFKEQVQDKAPSPNEALRWLRQVSTYYAGFIPGAQGFVNTTFDDLDKVREKHGDEVDKIVSQAYNELKGLTSKDLNLQTATQAWEIIQKYTAKIADLAGDAAEDILENHPQLQSAVGDNLKQLKQMGDQFGPQAKEQVEKTWSEIRDATKNGVNPQTVDKIRKIVQDKVEQLRKVGDQVWQKSLEQAQPYFDKNPKIKELLEDNADTLKKGNYAELFKQVKEAVTSGSTDNLEKYVQQAKDKAQQYTGDWDQYLKMIPGSGELGQKFEQLQSIAKAKGPEAQKLLEATMKDIQDVISKRSEEAKNIAQDAKKQA